MLAFCGLLSDHEASLIGSSLLDPASTTNHPPPHELSSCPLDPLTPLITLHPTNPGRGLILFLYFWKFYSCCFIKFNKGSIKSQAAFDISFI